MPSYLVAIATSAAGRPFCQTLYLLEGSTLAPDTVQGVVDTLLYDPVVQQAEWCALDDLAILAALPADARVIEVAFKPGVTDNEAESLLNAARRFGIDNLDVVRTLRRYAPDPDESPSTYYNDLIEIMLEYPAGAELEQRRAWYRNLLLQPAPVSPQIATVELREADDDELLRISRQGILALDLAEMQAIRGYFMQLRREPRDGELETIAQTWSEHCSHKTFKARVRYRETAGSRQPASDSSAHYPMLSRLGSGEVEIDSLIRSFLMQATQQVLEQRRQPPNDWVLSAFVDNAGIIAFDDDYEVSFKVETHNHPSALEPFGGANTGVGGVIRDVLGVSARPIANTDVLCFGDFAMDAAELSPGILHPRRICQGVVAGIRDYGNKLGIPTVNGAVLFDRGYTANPLVFCGTVGLAPRGRHPRQVQPGDAVVVLGGRTGRDGIHGATFSSEELTHSTAEDVGSAVQIGDPISEKKFMDVLLQARDQGMYHAITDCGAGGLSSAVGEMGAETGVAVNLEHVPLKYAGLQPWEIWLSEAQERMVLAVPPDRLAEFLQLCAGEDVEATAIGTFNDSGRLLVQHQGATLVDIDMHFLHDGRPQRVLDAVWNDHQPAASGSVNRRDGDAQAMLLHLLAHPTIASKERVVRTYDHEVGGMTVLKPLVGAQSDGPGDAAVLRPLATGYAALALGCGINPKYGEIDPYWMALACVDEALRNVVAVGGDPQRTAILDNFCWGDPRQADRMAGLVRAAAGCYDAAVAFGTPFISGKDSLNNEYRDSSGQRTPIPPTLLISALAHVYDLRQCVTMDLKQAGNCLYLVGTTRDELLGSHYALLAGGVSAGSRLPQVDLSRAPARCSGLHAAIRAGLVQACHDLSEGGLAVAAAEMAFAGNLGLDLDLAAVALEGDVHTDSVTLRLFAETPSRWLVEVAADQASAFEAALGASDVQRIGQVIAEPQLRIYEQNNRVLDVTLAELKAAWQHGLEGSGL